MHNRPSSPNMIFWKKIEAGKRWRAYDLYGNLLGYVRWSFDGWDGYIMTGEKYPNSERCVTGRYTKRLFWPMRRQVDEEICGPSGEREVVRK